MNITTPLNRFSQFQIVCLSIVSFLVLTWSVPAFCGDIHEAVKAGDLEKVKILLKGNPRLVMTRTKDGYTPLHLAAVSGHKEVAEVLLANKASVDARDNVGYTPLHLAARKGHKGMVELLLTQGAEVNAKTIMGITPLDMAAWDGHKDVEEFLKQHGGVNGVVGLYAPGDGVKEPVLAEWTSPDYTAEAKRAGVVGIVVLQAIIRKNGTVTDVKVVKGLGFGLDESAVKTVAEKWRFKPGTHNGEPVDVISTIKIGFR